MAPTSPTSLPTKPADFFNLVGMAEWFALDTKLAAKEGH